MDEMDEKTEPPWLRHKKAKALGKMAETNPVIAKLRMKLAIQACERKKAEIHRRMKAGKLNKSK